MHLNWYGYKETKEHEQFRLALKQACAELCIDAPNILNYGVEDAVVGVYLVENYGQLSWFGDGRDDIKSDILSNIEFIKCQEKYDNQKKHEEEIERHRLNSLTESGLKLEIENLRSFAHSKKEDVAKEIVHCNSKFDELIKLLTEVNSLIQTPEKVGEGLKVIVNRLKLIKLQEFYDNKFKKSIDNN